MDQIAEVLARLERIESVLADLRSRQAEKDWYSPEEFGSLIGRAEFTVQSWCRRGRINAKKRGSGRGGVLGWAISHEELLRYQRDGLLPET